MTLPLRAVVPLTQVPTRPRPVLAVVVVTVAAVVVTLVGWRGTAVLPRAVAAAACGPTWVTAWQAAMQPGPPPRAVAGGGTLRMVVRPQVEGAQIRVRLSNVYGSAPLAVDAVSAAPAGAGPPDGSAHERVVVAGGSGGGGAAGAGGGAAATRGGGAGRAAAGRAGSAVAAASVVGWRRRGGGQRVGRRLRRHGWRGGRRRVAGQRRGGRRRSVVPGWRRAGPGRNSP